MFMRLCFFHPQKPHEEDNAKVDIYKAEGSNYFNAKNFQKAIHFYSKAIAADRNNVQSSVLYRNRALCNFHLGNFEECVIDCNQSLQIDPNNEKTLFRRMLANEKLNNLKGANMDCQQVLKINPRNTGALEMLSRLDSNRRVSPAVSGLAYASTLDGLGRDLDFIQRPAHQQSRQLKRITIVDKSDTNPAATNVSLI